MGDWICPWGVCRAYCTQLGHESIKARARREPFDGFFRARPALGAFALFGFRDGGVQHSLDREGQAAPVSKGRSRGIESDPHPPIRSFTVS